MNDYKPTHYNSLSPYLIVDEAVELAAQLSAIFDATQLRRFDNEEGKIAHLELKLDDSVIMISDSTKNYPAQTAMLHCYVRDVHKTFEKAIAYGCEAIEKPVNKPFDPDTRGSFYDRAGNYWAISTQGNI